MCAQVIQNQPRKRQSRRDTKKQTAAICSKLLYAHMYKDTLSHTLNAAIARSLFVLRLHLVIVSS